VRKSEKSKKRGGQLKDTGKSKYRLGVVSEKKKKSKQGGGDR